MKEKPMAGKTLFVRIYGEFRYRWWLRPICWVLKHKKEWTNVYGIRYKQCSRCGKDFFTKKIKEKEKKIATILYGGEIGELHGIKFHHKR